MASHELGDDYSEGNENDAQGYRNEIAYDGEEKVSGQDR